MNICDLPLKVCPFVDIILIIISLCDKIDRVRDDLKIKERVEGTNNIIPARFYWIKRGN